MADTRGLDATDKLLQSAMEHPFEPTDVPVQLAALTPMGPSGGAAPTANATLASADAHPTEEDPWKAEFEAQVREWRAQSVEAREKADRERVRWEEVRKHEEEERQAVGQEPETWDTLGAHITSSIAAASEILAGSESTLPSTQVGKSPSQKWEHISSSPGSSYPSMSLSDPSGLSSPLLQRPSLPHPCPPTQPHQSFVEAKNPAIPPSTLPSIMDHTVARRTRISLILSSLAINLFLPFVNGVMLGFGEIFAKNVLVGWFGWKTQSGYTAANVGLRR